MRWRRAGRPWPRWPGRLFRCPSGQSTARRVFTETSVTQILRAPAAATNRTTSATTSGFVLAACSGRRFQPMLGLMTTRSPRWTKRPMPPMASTARRTFCAGSEPRAMAISTAPESRRCGDLSAWANPCCCRGRRALAASAPSHGAARDGRGHSHAQERAPIQFSSGAFSLSSLSRAGATREQVFCPAANRRHSFHPLLESARDQGQGSFGLGVECRHFGVVAGRCGKRRTSIPRWPRAIPRRPWRWPISRR